jgi:hypothetical protein
MEMLFKPWAAAHVRQRANALLRMRLLHGGDQRGCLGFAIEALASVACHSASVGLESMLLPSSLTEPISMGMFFEISERLHRRSAW